MMVMSKYARDIRSILLYEAHEIPVVTPKKRDMDVVIRRPREFALVQLAVTPFTQSLHQLVRPLHSVYGFVDSMIP
jgi:hypothetical protein